MRPIEYQSLTSKPSPLGYKDILPFKNHIDFLKIKRNNFGLVTVKRGIAATNTLKSQVYSSSFLVNTVTLKPLPAC